MMTYSQKDSLSSLPSDRTFNPIALIHLSDGGIITMELLPEAAPNTTASFLWAASHGWLDHHAIERIVPGSWVDVSYRAFGHDECKYLIPNEFSLNPFLTPLPSRPGCVCMGGYGDAGLSGCEFFFPLRECPEHLGIYPVFGHILSGMDEIMRVAQVPIKRIYPKGCDGVEINEPLEPQIIDHIGLELRGYHVHEPAKMDVQNLPACWL